LGIRSTASSIAGQGIATDGQSLFASLWTGTTSYFQQFDGALNPQGIINNPTGMGSLTNIVDFAYDGSTGTFFGLATDYEFGTDTESNTVLQFNMGGAVVASYTLPFLADGIGAYNPIPEPHAAILLAAGGLALSFRPRRVRRAWKS
jgi:hypothetical protein